MLEFTESSIRTELESTDHAAPPSYALFRVGTQNASIAKSILVDIMKFRRISGPRTDCALSPCEKCLEPHLAKIISAVEQSEPVTLVLPAFPGKSPNPAKVLGALPDMAEKRALEFLQHLCNRVKAYYAPGARIILCSDGRVFSDVVGLRDEDVTAYQREISRIIEDSGLTSISTFDLDDVYEDLDFDQMRTKLMSEYGESLETLKATVHRGKANDGSVDDKEANRLYCGITRFLVEDAMSPEQTQSRTAIQKECRARAYTVIQRSKAWGDWVEARFPHAVRLSIHPQTCGAKKLGIKLIEPDHWLTPWHSVAVEVDGRFVLMKRAEAEALGAELIHAESRPSHYILTKEKPSSAQGIKHGS